VPRREADKEGKIGTQASRQKPEPNTTEKNNITVVRGEIEKDPDNEKQGTRKGGVRIGSLRETNLWKRAGGIKVRNEKHE